MRETNYRSVTANKPVVTITSTLYDRRALDVVSDIPLINSLNHLTYLTSNSAKIRDIIANDGALERLVGILHNCYFSHLEISYQQEILASRHIRADVMEMKQRQALHAWKWTLAFQCLVLTGTRGSELIRNRVVSAGVLPLLATVLDNYLLYSKNYDFINGTYLSFDFKKMNLDSHESYLLLKKSNNETFKEYLTNLIGDSIYHLPEDIYHFDEVLLKSKLTKETDFGLLWETLYDGTIDEDAYESNIFMDIEQIIPDILIPRDFYLGRIVPKQDDVIWSLQLLAFISKYTYMKKSLQKVVPDERLSFRPIIDRIRQRLIMSKGKSLPLPLLNSKNGDIDSTGSNESTNSSNDKFELEIRNPNISIDNDYQNVINSSKISFCSSLEIHTDMEDDIDDVSDVDMESALPLNENSFLAELRDVANTCDEKSAFHKNDQKICNVTNPYKHLGLKIKPNLKMSRIEKERFLRDNFIKNWKYEELSMNIDDHDIHSNDSNLPMLNLFPLVEKYTVTSDNPKDVIYWSSVIMCNSCRKNEATGVRQCSNFSCGKWEEYPRQFAKCRRCKRTKYCSRKCQLKAWTYHRYWCHEASANSKNSTSNGGIESDTTTPNDSQGGNSTDISEVIATNMSNLSTTEVMNNDEGSTDTHVTSSDNNDEQERHTEQE
ncbi:hypothetical protein C6P45_002647 [Maudiozyma exigua]|uniref:MYND-type domain-containing protein n=1 Tax=Maudiozyma exigua TaxID=34358 RepID=A0A9P6VW38_MAUEX|nr:hypothetical protein C6P45_002647 [Kazachstania exigua]